MNDLTIRASIRLGKYLELDMNLIPFKIQWWRVRPTIYPINSRLKVRKKLIKKIL